MNRGKKRTFNVQRSTLNVQGWPNRRALFPTCFRRLAGRGKREPLPPLPARRRKHVVSAILRSLIFLCAIISTTFVASAQLVLRGPAVIVNGQLIHASEPQAPKPELNTAKQDAVLFRNGDFLYGDLEAIDAQKNIRWHHPDAAQAIEFSPTNIAEIALRSRSREKSSSTNACVIRLTNQDELEGNLLSFDGEKIILETWFAGTLTLPRKMVQSIVPKPPSRPARFDGLTGLEGWTRGKSVLAQQDYGSWSYKNGAFYATKAASIARDLKLPDVASIQFDVAWKGIFHVAIALYTDSLQPVSLAAKENEPDFGGFYSLQLNNYTASDLIAIKKRDPLRSLGQITVPGFQQKSSAQIELRVSKPKRSIAILVDGNVIKEWQDTDEFAGAGTAMRFVHQGQGAVKLSNLRVSDWDGQMEKISTNAPDPNLDLARLRNGDRVNGSIQSIRNGKLTVDTGASKLEIPLARLRQLDFAGRKGEVAKSQPDDVRVFFPRGESLTFHLEKWDAQGVIGSSPNFGKVKFDPTAFARIEFMAKAAAE